MNEDADVPTITIGPASDPAVTHLTFSSGLLGRFKTQDRALRLRWF